MGWFVKSVLSLKGCHGVQGILHFTNRLGPDSANDIGRRANLVTRNKMRTTAISLAFVVLMTMVCAPGAYAASDLKLAPRLSFDDDSSPNFPIQGLNLSEGSIARGQATVIFFGTSNCWNTAREADRLVSYTRSSAIGFAS